MKVERLPDSKVSWITRRDIIAAQLDSGAAKLTYHAQGYNIPGIRSTVRELQAAGHGPEVEVAVVEGPPAPEQTVGKRGYSIEPWTGELVPLST